MRDLPNMTVIAPSDSRSVSKPSAPRWNIPDPSASASPAAQSLRFLSYLTIEEASARMGYSYDAGKRLSAQAMRAARAIWEACHAAQ